MSVRTARHEMHVHDSIWECDGGDRFRVRKTLTEIRVGIGV
jgi:hypothetical protein